MDADARYAAELLDSLETGASVAAFTARDPAFDAARAYAVAERVHAARLARGERAVGRKIGFTNRTIWDEYGVHEPIWGFVYDATVSHAPSAEAALALGRLAEPRIEPEIVLHFAAAPPVTGDETALLACIDWIAHGFEIVQSPFPGWKFKVQDTIAVNGLHGRLVVGPHIPVGRFDGLAQRLREFRIALLNGDRVESEGGGANVLDSPLLAFAHLAGVLARLPQFPPVAAGEIVTTGTLTRALPVRAGETWHTRLDGLALPGMRVTFSEGGRVKGEG
jgi:2-oxo-3-hexenedioate decarboxylase